MWACLVLLCESGSDISAKPISLMMCLITATLSLTLVGQASVHIVMPNYEMRCSAYRSTRLLNGFGTLFILISLYFPNFSRTNF